MAKSKEFEREYKEEGKKRILIRKELRKYKIELKEQHRQQRITNCCEGNPNCNGTTDCMWY